MEWNDKDEKISKSGGNEAMHSAAWTECILIVQITSGQSSEEEDRQVPYPDKTTHSSQEPEKMYTSI